MLITNIRLHPAILFSLPLLLACGGNTSNSSPAAASDANTPVAEAAASPASEPAAPATDNPEQVQPASQTAASNEPTEHRGATLEDGTPVEETRTAAVIQDTFKSNRPKVRACFDESLKKHPGLKGNITVSFVIDPKGKVKQASINAARSDLAVPELNTCVIDAVLKIEFPPSSRGFESQGNYPFNFNP